MLECPAACLQNFLCWTSTCDNCLCGCVCVCFLCFRLELLLQRANKIQNMALECEEKLTLAKNTLQAVSIFLMSFKCSFWLTFYTYTVLRSTSHFKISLGFWTTTTNFLVFLPFIIVCILPDVWKRIESISMILNTFFECFLFGCPGHVSNREWWGCAMWKRACLLPAGLWGSQPSAQSRVESPPKWKILPSGSASIQASVQWLIWFNQRKNNFINVKY